MMIMVMMMTVVMTMMMMMIMVMMMMGLMKPSTMEMISDQVTKGLDLSD